MVRFALIFALALLVHLGAADGAAEMPPPGKGPAPATTTAPLPGRPAAARPLTESKTKDEPAAVVNPVEPQVTEPKSDAAKKEKAKDEQAEMVAEVIEKTDEEWFERGNQLPRLAHGLTTGRVAARPIGIDYRLRPGDRVRLVTWGGSALNELVIVDGNGSLAAPGFGAIPVGGRSQTEAQQLLAELVRSHFKQGGAALGVEQAGGVSVTVAGEVASAGFHTLPPGASILDALAVAGGVTDEGSLRAIAVRTPDGATTTLDLYQLAIAGKADGIGAVANGTFVFVPLRGPQVQVFGAVRRGAAIELREGEALAAAVSLAGGLAAEADPGLVRLAREGTTGQEMRQLTFADLANEPVRDGDRLLVVARSSFDQARRTLTIIGEVRSPGRYAWEEGLTVGRLIAFAGGTLPEANTAEAIVRRQLAEPVALDQGAGLTRPSLYEVLAPVTADTLLLPRDELVLPAFPRPEDNDLVITVSGAVRRPGTQPLSPGLTVQQAVLLAGGVTADAQLDIADLVRLTLRADGSHDTQRLAVDLHAVLAGASGPQLMARDQLVVRTRNDQRLTVMITGEVRNSGSFSLAHGTTLSQVLQIAGGLTPDAFVDGIRLFRESEKEAGTRFLEEMKAQIEGAVAVNRTRLTQAHSSDDAETLQLTIANQEQGLLRLQKARATGRLTGIDIRGMLDGRVGVDLELRDGDTIEVPTRPQAVRVLGEVMSPGSLRFEANMKVSTVVQRSGGYSQQADRKRIFVVRADGSVVATGSGKGLEWDGAKRNWITTDLSSIVLREGDAVIVPPDLTYKPSWRVVAKDFAQILFQVSIAAATVIAVTG